MDIKSGNPLQIPPKPVRNHTLEGYLEILFIRNKIRSPTRQCMQADRASYFAIVFLYSFTSFMICFSPLPFTKVNKYTPEDR